MRLALITLALGLTYATAAADSHSLRAEDEPFSRKLLSPPFCQLEQGVDYVGNDLKNVPGAQAMDCCSRCDETSGCKAFSWTNLNGGTCWLKRGVGPVIAQNPGVTSGRAEGPPMCILEENTNYVGNDIGNAKAPEAYACCDICRANPACFAYSWSSHEGGTCWLKSGKGRTEFQWLVKSSEVYPNLDTCNLDLGVDYVGNDIGRAKSPDVGGCCDICLTWNGCRAFTWSNHEGGTCWLKSGRGSIVANPNVISSLVVAPSCSIRTGVDYVGNDIGRAKSSDAGGCCDICRNWNGCRAFAWTNIEGGTCWLKSAQGSVVANTNVQVGNL